MTYTITFLLNILYGIYGMTDGNSDFATIMKNDPGIATELGIDQSCPTCDMDAIKLKIIDLESQKDGGITGSDLGAN